MKFTRRDIFIFLCTWLIATAVGIYLRTYPLRHTFAHPLEERATLIVIQNLQKSIRSGIDRSSPTLSETERERAAKTQLDEVLRNEKQKVRTAIKIVSQKLAADFPEKANGRFLLASDSFYYYQLTENIVETGNISEQIKGSKYLNPLMNTPHGFWEPLRLHPYLGYLIYRVLSFFSPEISLMDAVSFTPLVILPLITCVFMLGCRILGCSAGASFLATVFLLCVPVFLRRSMFGWYDDDPPNVFFLFTIPTVFFYGIQNLATPRTSRVAAIICAGLFTCYSLFWHGWVFLASVTFLSGLAMLLFVLIKDARSPLLKNLAAFGGIMLAGTILGISAIIGPREILILYQEGWSALQDFINPRLSLWPDLYIAVGELLPPTFSQWVKMQGGAFFLLISGIGLTAALVSLARKPLSATSLPIIFLLLTSLITVKLSLGAQRFAILGLVPAAWGFALGLELFWKLFLRIPLPVIVRPLTAGIAITVLTILPLWQAQAGIPQLLNRIYNPVWDFALRKIKEDTPPDSVINTWWPPGHFIKAIAQRRVTFDGATINQPQSYWIANALLDTNEEKAAGILRMLNISGNDAVDYLVEQRFPLSRAVRVLHKILGKDIVSARVILREDLNEKQTEHLLSLTHGEPPPTYLLIYNDMATDSLQFNFVGGWNFEKIEALRADPGALKKIPQRGSKEYISFLWDLAGGPPRYSPFLGVVREQGSQVIIEEGIIFDRENKTITIDSPRFGQGIPQSIFFEDNGNFVEKPLPQPTLPYSAMIIQDRGSIKCMLAERKLARSILMRLYFYEGKGLRMFEPFIYSEDETGRTRIVVHKINWSKF